ncbi:MAG: hypothetical protein JW915_06430 [Chitinispirillaceae bacterium]|nr:hypothetical protein [Chitinispirillaceae bacterium]
MQIIHHNDFDGMASAGIFANFIDSTSIESKDIFFDAIDYNRINDYYNIDFHNSSCVLDFPFNPTVKWWFDHHNTSFRDDSYQKDYKPSPYRYWNSRYKSCPSLLFYFFKKNYPTYYSQIKTVYNELVKQSNLIDSAMYVSPQQVYDFHNKFILFNHSLNHCYSDKLVYQFINSIRNRNINDFFDTNQFREAGEVVINTFDKYNNFFKCRINLEQNLILLNFLEAGLRGDRFLGYLYKPDADYTITIDKKNSHYYLGVGYNPWKKNNSINIGNLLKRYGGGGRMNVGAVLFDTIEELEAAILKIKQKLQKL